ncbi:MAG: helix-turn-helix domain-containing protein [Gemmatimonadetes bacterium]|nr:helix-turn-helix domain-containing protein [Gemmatimonadota bacterium]
MGTYHQLTEYQRYQIYALKKAGHDQQSIAATVGVSPETPCLSRIVFSLHTDLTRSVI